MKSVIVVFVATILVGCASGSALVVGQVRPAIEDFNAVTIFRAMPERAEEIAIVKASSGMGLTQQQRLDYAFDELKKQAAKLGATAIVITDRDTLAGDYMRETEIIEGVAVFME